MEPKMVQIVTEVHTPTKSNAITCWGKGFRFILIRFWLKTKSWELKPEEKWNHLAECPQYKNNPYCYQRFYFRQIVVQLPGLQYPIDLSEDIMKENQKKSMLAVTSHHSLKIFCCRINQERDDLEVDKEFTVESSIQPDEETQLVEQKARLDEQQKQLEQVLAGFTVQRTPLAASTVVQASVKPPTAYHIPKLAAQPASTQAIQPAVSNAVPAIQVPQRDPAIDGGIPDVYTAEEDKNYPDEPDAWNYKFYESSAVDGSYGKGIYAQNLPSKNSFFVHLFLGMYMALLFLAIFLFLISGPEKDE
uniref:Uncharacterized protein n=1 Tax=Romanomermis culicivorax TaxID=13658 RepID=A0A915J813_ROMCU